jgi:general secretion pathway protein E/type IV pilus assembly protein PilB
MDIGSLLVRRGLVSEEQMQSARQRANGRRVDQILVDVGAIDEQDVLQALADELAMEYIDLKDFQVDRELLSRFPTTAIFRHEVLPLQSENGHITVATSDPFDLEALDELSALGDCRIEPVLACRDEIVELIKRNLGVGGDTINELFAQRTAEEGIELLEGLPDDIGELAADAQAPSVIRLVNELLMEALELKASDVHLEPQEHGLVIRFRVDGLLRIQPVPPEINHFASAIVTRLKIMSRLNIAEKRLPQDGRIKLKVKSREIDVRVSIIPMLHGEGIVMRLLDKSRMKFDLASVGMPEQILKPFREVISLPHGIVLVTGPTGSGKTTTLYSGLNEIKSPETKIITVEDPVEYHMDGISQIQVHSRIGLTFAAGLRSILRHDPDVVLIGEIRDGETASSAIQASLTGHLVFSTLHTNDAPGAFTRLVDMGVEPYLVASTVEAVLAQRLTRILCKECKEEYVPNPDDLPPDLLPLKPRKLWRAVGCRACRETGYTGRTGVYELLMNDAHIRKMCVEQASAGEIRDYALSHGMMTLRQSGYQKAIAGITSLEDVLRITRGDVA